MRFEPSKNNEKWRSHCIHSGDHTAYTVVIAEHTEWCSWSHSIQSGGTYAAVITLHAIPSHNIDHNTVSSGYNHHFSQFYHNYNPSLVTVPSQHTHHSSEFHHGTASTVSGCTRPQLHRSYPPITLLLTGRKSVSNTIWVVSSQVCL